MLDAMNIQIAMTKNEGFDAKSNSSALALGRRLGNQNWQRKAPSFASKKMRFPLEEKLIAPLIATHNGLKDK